LMHWVGKRPSTLAPRYRPLGRLGRNVKRKRFARPYLDTEKTAFCSPNGIGVRRVSTISLKAWTGWV
jgi:hypothetical protein